MGEYTEDQLRPMLGYIGTVRDALRMQNWNVILHRTMEEDTDTHAHMWTQNNHTCVNIELGPEFFDQPPAVVREVVVHELVHAQHRDVNALWEGCTVDNSDVPQSQSKAWDGDFRMFMERFVSWVTQKVAPSMPTYDPKKRYEAPVGCWLHGEQEA